MNILIAILVFCLIIIIHETGHFSAARIFKMRVYEFSLGMGPVILKKQGKETVYQIKLIPFGGSVQLGEDEESDDPNAFKNKPVWQRMIVILAGAIMNLVLGLIICLITVIVSKNIITTTVEGFREGAVSNNYLQAGDEILAINGMSIFTATDMSYQITNTSSKIAEDENKALFDFKVKRNGETVELDGVAFNAVDNENGGKSIYFDFYVHTAEKSFINVVSEGFKQSLTLSRLIIISLVDLLRGTYGLNDMAGPVGVVSEINKVAATMQLSELFTMIALITLNVGIFNLLPIPALDGSRFIFFVIEAIRRKPVKAEVEGMIHFVGFAALMVLMVIITFNDIRKLIFGG